MANIDLNMSFDCFSKKSIKGEKQEMYTNITYIVAHI